MTRVRKSDTDTPTSTRRRGTEIPPSAKRHAPRPARTCQRRLKLTVERLPSSPPSRDSATPSKPKNLELREAGQRISKATIYRTLKHLLDAVLLKQVHFGGGKQAHYDFIDPADAHDHLVDLDSGKIIRISSEQIVKLREEIARKMGFTAVSHRFHILARRRQP